MKKNMKKRNNKGFSLVELIVVVLIMAIIAVALAPQVMKWVENSRKANDATLVDSVCSAGLLALADVDAYKEAGDKTFNLTITSSGVAVSDDTLTHFASSLAKNLGVTALTDNALHAKASSANYTVTFTKGVITARPDFESQMS